ncbi:MAG: hypothetical protein IT365_01270 [Candidatus Hydrogenedentes bacterium]|nr:hypothetical protein [Candidatus Hydrogenedentota bacterium]
MLIDMTQSAALVIENLDSILQTPPGTASAHDNEMLAEECKERWVSDGIWSMIVNWKSVDMVPNAQIQSLSWIAECNKRMLFDQPDVRARQRERILSKVNEQLKTASNPEEVRGLLDAAYRTMFYGAFVRPENGLDAANAIIDLFKKYVPGSDPIVHNFACAKLREMGYLQSDRRNELRAFLVEQAPELRPELLMEHRSGVNYDTFLGSDVHGTHTESEYLALPGLSPHELAALIESTLKGRRSVNALGYGALRKLVQDACKANEDASLTELANLLRRGIYIWHTLPLVAREAAEARSEADQQAAQKCLDSAIRAIEEIPEEEWTRTLRTTPEKLIENARGDVDLVNKSSPDSPAYLYVKQSLEEAAERLAAKKAEAATNR